MRNKKSVLLSLSIMLAATQAHAAQPFFGKFTVDHSNCNDSVFQDAQRVYVSVQNDFGAKALYLQAYGQDAGAASVLLGSGSRQAPGTDVKIHGVVTQSWQTQVRGNVLMSIEKTSRPSTGYDSQTVTKLTDYGQMLVIENISTDYSSKKTEQTYCRLIRTN